MPEELPNSARQEQSLLGALMVYPETYSDCRDLDLQSDEFFLPSHQRIYDAMSDLAEHGRPIDIKSVVQRLEDTDDLQAAGGIDYLATLLDGAVSGANARFYIETIKNKAQLRSLIEAADSIIQSASSSGEEMDEILDNAERMVMNVTRQRRGSDFESAATVVDRVVSEIEVLRKQEGITGIQTGYIALDKMTNGFHPGDLIILAARPAMGKSALALNFANRVAQRNDGCVAIFSLEMPSDSLIKRLMSAESQVSADKLRNGKVDDDELGRLYEAGNRLSDRKIFIDDTSAVRVSQIFSKCRKLKSEYDAISLVVIDYLQLLSGSGKSDSRVQEVSEISRNLKILAKEMDCPVIALSQLSRKVEERTSHEPQLADLRESGSIEQDADIVMFLYREEYYNSDADPNATSEVVDLSLAKHRNGAIGKINLVFEKNISRFSNHAGDDIYAG